jgi:putative glycosyltransferase
LPVGRKVRDKTTYSYWRRWKMFLDSVTNFSEVPLIGIFYLGIAIAAMSILVSAWLMLRWLISGVAVAGWLSVMMSVWFLGGIAVFCVGVIGMYLGTETKNRPITIVRKVHQAIRVQGGR